MFCCCCGAVIFGAVIVVVVIVDVVFVVVVDLIVLSTGKFFWPKIYDQICPEKTSLWSRSLWLNFEGGKKSYSENILGPNLHQPSFDTTIINLAL